MNVYFGKMKDETECETYCCSGGQGIEYFGGIQHGDYAFMRLAKDGANVKRLWKLDRIEVDANNKSMAYFTNVFDFNNLSTEEFTRLKLFKVGIVFGNKVWKTNKKIGFFKVDLISDSDFTNATIDQQTFNQYILEQNNYRKILFADSTSSRSNFDIQICKNGNKYEIYNNTEPFMSGLCAGFNTDRYPDYITFLQNNPSVKPIRTRKKVKEWLESEGRNGKITIANIWDFFCSKQSFKISKNKEVDEEADDYENADENSNNMTSAGYDDFKNLIIYGIPGCGKSYRLKTNYLNTFAEDKIVRTTFHPEYSNTDFIGQVRPIKNGKNLEYTVVPGPFSKALLLSLKYPENKIALVIEEINRGNASSIFGDLFQLLDRKSNGESEYEISNEIISSYLKENGIERDKIRISSNLYLYATMNTSDQNVFKLDTAFKRRWEFERLTNKDTENDVNDFSVFKIGSTIITWKVFVKKVNNIISTSDDISGDRQIGNFFYQGSDNDLKRFANKVLEYLYNDVCKYGDGKDLIFNTSKYKTFDDIYDAFVSGENVFADSLFEEEILNTLTNEKISGSLEAENDTGNVDDEQL